jgi:hypothetical protein
MVTLQSSEADRLVDSAQVAAQCAPRPRPSPPPSSDEGARETYELDDFNICDGKHPFTDGLRVLKEPVEFAVDALLATWLVFNSIATMMIILMNFRSDVPPKLRHDFGEARFEAVMDAVCYAPMCFFALVFLIVNNYFSERIFYMFLRRRIIIDYPESAAPGYIFGHAAPLLFLATFALYALYSVAVLVYFEAPAGVIFIFLNNLGVGVGLVWFKQQGIENRFISVSAFIQSFPDADFDYDNIDAASLKAAADHMERITLVECRDACYQGRMRAAWFNYLSVPSVLRGAFNAAVVAVLAGLVAACYFYFLQLSHKEDETNWTLKLNPCIEACADGVNLTGTVAAGDARGVCGWCAARCVKALHLGAAHRTLASCHALLSTAMCAGGDVVAAACANVNRTA